MAKTRYLLDTDSPSELGVAAALHQGLMRGDVGDVQASAIRGSLLVRTEIRYCGVLAAIMLRGVESVLHSYPE